MTAQRWSIVRQVFDDAVARPPDARAEFLAAACGDDDELRAEVRSLLEADEGPSPALLDAQSGAIGVAIDWELSDGTDEDGGAILRAPRDGEPIDDAGPGAHAGQVIGPYQLVREIGRGGMGTVYLAEREDVGKRVALKLLRDGRATPGAVRRLLLERRVLARLEHPLIAQLLDAGVTEAGVPYFAMEYVDGAPLVAACDARGLGVPERVGLFAQVCDAVAYAHRNLVVHRDLKPSNVLVTADGAVRLLDFGIAKLLSAAEDADAAPVGGHDAGPAVRNDGQTSGAWLMTPQYAAPEQRRGEAVTTATDVYALGLLLRELVSGERPPVPLPSVAELALRMGGGLVAPDTPPANVGAKRAGRVVPSGAVARTRGTTPDRLRRALTGDLDAIVARATAEDATARYTSAEGLADDLRRHLAHLPVRARPSTRAYRLRTFLRRNRWGVASVAGLFVLLTAGVVVATVQQARTGRALAQATAEASKARQVTQFVASLLQDADPYRSRAGTVTVSAASDRLVGAVADRLERELADQPAVRTELLRTLGVVERNRGRFDDAERLLRRGLAIAPAKGQGAEPDAERAGLLHELGVVGRMRSDFAGADTLLRQALAIRTLVPGTDSADLAATRYELGALRRYQGRYPEAQQLLQLALTMRRGKPGAARAEVLDELASVRVFLRDPDSCAVLMRQSIALRERWQGHEHPLVADAYTRLSGCLLNAGRTPAAEATVRHALILQEGRLAPGHPDRIRAESQLSWVLATKGEYAEAERVQRHVLAEREALYGHGRDVAGSLFTLGFVRYKRGDAAGALPLMRRAIQEYAAVLGPDRTEVNDVRRAFAPALAAAGREAEALAVTRDLIRADGPTWDDVAQPAAVLADNLRAESDCARAVPLYQRAITAYQTRHPATPAGDEHVAAMRAGLAACGPR